MKTLKYEPLTPYERETIVNFNDKESTMEIYTASISVMNKLDKLVNEFPKYYSIKKVDTTEGKISSKTYVCVNKKLLSFRKPRILTEEQKKEVSERLRKNLV